MAHKVKKIILSSLIVGNHLSTIAPMYVRATASDTTQENTDSILDILEQESNIQETVDAVSEQESNDQETVKSITGESLDTKVRDVVTANMKISTIAKSSHFAEYNKIYKIYRNR